MEHKDILDIYADYIRTSDQLKGMIPAGGGYFGPDGGWMQTMYWLSYQMDEMVKEITKLQR